MSKQPPASGSRLLAAERAATASSLAALTLKLFRLGARRLQTSLGYRSTNRVPKPI